MDLTDDGFESRTYSAQDGLRLFYREYGDVASDRTPSDLTPPNLTPIICLSGLTRNSADFHDFALRFSPHRRVIALDYRGRGRSAYDPNPQNYRAGVYASDLLHLLMAANISRAVVVGTSLGGLLAMSLAAQRPAVLAGVVLNDIGPDIDGTGSDNVSQYLAADMRPRTWDEATAMVKDISSDAAPDFSDAQWMALTRRSFREDENGNIRVDFDPAVGAAFLKAEPLPDLWPLYGGLRHVPVLAIRGAISDMLSSATFDRMAEIKPDLVRITVPNRGHVPWLDEPECVAALDTFIPNL